VGSIGVILGPFKHYNTVISESTASDSITTKDGIDTFYITAGGYKDVGTPDREMSVTEKAALQAGTDQAYKVFVDFVATRRKISSDKIRNDIKALPYSEQQALDFKLIDKIGSQDVAYQALADKAGLASGNFQVVRVNNIPDFWSLLMGGDLFSFWKPVNAKQVDVSIELSGKMLYLYNDQQYLK
jgi:protease-4